MYGAAWSTHKIIRLREQVDEQAGLQQWPTRSFYVVVFYLDIYHQSLLLAPCLSDDEAIDGLLWVTFPFSTCCLGAQEVKASHQPTWHSQLMMYWTMYTLSHHVLVDWHCWFDVVHRQGRRCNYHHELVSCSNAFLILGWMNHQSWLRLDNSIGVQTLLTLILDINSSNDWSAQHVNPFKSSSALAILRNDLDDMFGA